MRTKKNTKDHTLTVVVVCIVAITGLLTHAVFGKRLRNWMRDLANTAQVEEPGSGSVQVDVTQADLDKYAGNVVSAGPLDIRIITTTDEYIVEVEGERETFDTQVTFKVNVMKPFRFASIPIERMVRDGLNAERQANSGRELTWRGFTIATNRSTFSWSVTVRDLSGQGVIRLSVGAASATCSINMLKLFPIWNYVRYASPTREQVYIGNILRVPSSPPILPDKNKGLCGFKLLAVAGRSVWFEVLYGTQSVPGLRRRWPGLDIHYRLLDNGSNFTTLRFEGGKEMQIGDEARFEDDGSVLKLDADAFPAKNAVIFRHYDVRNQPLGDILCVTMAK